MDNHIFQVTVGDVVEEMLFSDVLALSPYTVLYFYPKDKTSGCTLEAQEFQALVSSLSGLGVQVVGVSKDTAKSHCSFADKEGLTFPLIVDSELVLHDNFSTMGEKKMYGRVYQGTIRSTFLLDKHGTILCEWRNVKARGHAQLVYEHCKNI